jgi:hypothetical protein
MLRASMDGVGLCASLQHPFDLARGSRGQLSEGAT